MQKPEKRFSVLLQKYQNAGFIEKHYPKLDVVKNYRLIISTFNYIKIVSLIIFFALLITHSNWFNDSQCVLQMPSDASKWFREPETCDICEKLHQVKKLTNISVEIFYNDFFTSAQPVVITDGAKNWMASKFFSFDFFKEIYSSADDDQEKTCQFFPYQTEFSSLYEVLEMDSKRANFELGQKPWYVGWSNCNDKAGQILRKYYETPYFLPNISENIALNWIFMGGPGQGAHMHVDNVQYPSWQAQVKGRKLWRLAPPPECYYKCEEMETIVEPGEIIVIDTNRWYHQTFILPGEISITIGSEFD